ncbi:MAG: S8 family serine peptidase [Acidimicrobiales bacterium]
MHADVAVVAGRSQRGARARAAAALVVLLCTLLTAGSPAVADGRGAVGATAPTDAVPTVAPIVAAAAPQVVPGSFVVRTEGPAGAAERRAIAAEAGGTPGLVVAPDTFVVEVPPTRGAATQVLGLAEDGIVAEVQPEHVYTAADTEPNDTCWRGNTCLAPDGTPSFGGQVELRNVGAAKAWDLTRGSAAVVVAVLDTRIETSPPHRDLVGKLLPGRSFVPDRTCTGSTSARDHGTVSAGLISAQPDNASDMAGLGWNTRVLPVEVLNDCGSGTTSAVAAGIRWAADNGARIINMSLTGASRDPVVSAAVAYAQSKGLLVVAAAGNQGSSNKVWPAADLGVVAVGATGLPGTSGEDRLAEFSNFGSWVDIAAPGVDVIGLRRVGGSTTPFDGTTRATGTSFAAPIVAAAAGLVMAKHPGLSAEQVAARLAVSAAQIPGSGTQLSWGRLDAAAALGTLPSGYRLAAADGGLFSFGDAPFAGSAAGRTTAPIVGAASHLSGRGYWLAASDGRVHPFGAAPSLGSAPVQPSGQTVAGMAATPGGDGYWLVTAAGGIFPFGMATDLGSRAGTKLNQPVVGIAAAQRGDGYWLLARDGGIFTYGAARFFGSTGSLKLNKPVVGMAPTPSGGGYWLVASDGGIFAFGDARFFGSTGAIALNKPIVGMAPTRSGNGYWLVASDGGIFAFGDAAFLGSTGAIKLNQPIVAMLTR